MSLPTILLPAFVQVGLTFFLIFAMGRARFAALRLGEIDPKTIALGQRAWPTRAQQISNTFSNQFEMPILFYLIVGFAIATRKADLPFVLMSWAFVLTRLGHAYVYATSNTLMLRFRIFLAGAVILLAMWLVFAVRILAGL